MNLVEGKGSSARDGEMIEINGSSWRLKAGWTESVSVTKTKTEVGTNKVMVVMMMAVEENDDLNAEPEIDNREDDGPSGEVGTIWRRCRWVKR